MRWRGRAGSSRGVAPSIDVRRPGDAGEVCEDAGTRYQRYSCVHGLGHAFMRLHGDRLEPSLELTALGEPAPDCAQGAYHDYWFAVVGADERRFPAAARVPAALCALPGGSCGPAGIAPSSTTARPGSWSTRGSTSTSSAAT